MPPDNRGFRPFWATHRAWFMARGWNNIDAMRAYHRSLNIAQRRQYLNMRSGNLPWPVSGAPPPNPVAIQNLLIITAVATAAMAIPPAAATVPQLSRVQQIFMGGQNVQDIVGRIADYLILDWHQENGQEEEGVLAQSPSLYDHLTQNRWNIAVSQKYPGLGISRPLEAALANFVPPSSTLFISIDSNATRVYTRSAYHEQYRWVLTHRYLTWKVDTGPGIWGADVAPPAGSLVQGMLVQLPIPNKLRNFCWQAWYRVCVQRIKTLVNPLTLDAMA
jgi:hypothetical protein